MTDVTVPRASSRPVFALFSRLERAMLTRESGAWLAAFRALFGLAMCVSMLRFIGYGWVDELFTNQAFHFKYWGFGWAEAPSPALLHALFWALAVSALGVATGTLFRASAAFFFAGFTYVGLIDVANYLNHYYLASLLALLLAVSPAHRRFSVDAWLRPSLASASIPAGFHYVFRVQIGVVYTFAAIAKAQPDWLIHAQPLRIWLGARSDLPLVGPLFSLPFAPELMSWGGFLFDLSAPWLLLWGRTRLFAFVILIVFHGFVRALFPIGMFSAIMVLSALVFFPADWPLRLLERIGIRSPSPQLNAERGVAEKTAWTRVALGAFALYALVQIAVPLRFLAYGGNVLWHEQGMRFSFRVMAREKNGSVTFLVKNKRSGRVLHVSPRRYLSPLQEREMSAQPDLILALAHHIARDFESRGEGPVEVRVDALVSLNGRRAERLIAPDVDLTTVEDGLLPATFVLPAPFGPPPSIRPI
jgi:vitamin K-dependent gamma-carboxylase